MPIEPWFLIIIFILFFVFSINRMIRNADDLHVLAYLVLFIYTIFAQIGYAYFPEYSIILGAYYGPEMFFEYWFFMFGSFVMSFMLYSYMHKRYRRRIYFVVKESGTGVNSNFIILYIIMGFGLYFYFTENKALFQWGGSQAMGGIYFGHLFRLFSGYTIIIYYIFRDNGHIGNLSRKLSLLPLLAGTNFILVVSSAAGSRSDILYLFLAIITFEASPFRAFLKYRKRGIISIIFIVYVLVSYLQVLLISRTGASIDGMDFMTILSLELLSGDTSDIANRLIVQDYFSPSHTLFVSIKYGIIDIYEVIISNIANSLFGFGYPTIGETIINRSNLGVYTRGTGWAYHHFVEGYNAIGISGIFYNALIWNLGLFFWTIHSKTDNKKLNRYVLPLLAYFIMNTMRSQSAMYIRYYWSSFLPLLLVLLYTFKYKIKYRNLKVSKTL